MAFIVTGVAREEAVSFSFEEPGAALRKARELETDRALEVVLTDADGLQYPTSTFERIFLTPEPTI